MSLGELVMTFRLGSWPVGIFMVLLDLLCLNFIGLMPKYGVWVKTWGYKLLVFLGVLGGAFWGVAIDMLCIGEYAAVIDVSYSTMVAAINAHYSTAICAILYGGFVGIAYGGSGNLCGDSSSVFAGCGVVLG